MVVRRNKETVKDRSNIRPEPIFLTPMQDKIEKFIKNHPDCTRRDIYEIKDIADGDIRRSLLRLLKSRRVKETFTII